MKNIILILALAFNVVLCNAQKTRYPELSKNSINKAIECDTVSNLQYYKSGNKINLSWDVPGQINLSHSGDYDDNAIGTGIELTVSHKYESDELSNYIGFSIIKISFLSYEKNCIYTIKVWKENNGVMEVVASQLVEYFVPKQYNTVTLLNPVIIEDNSTYYFGFNAKNSGYQAGVDKGPAIPGKGDLYLDVNDNWISLYETTGGNSNYNFCIKTSIAANSDAKVVNLGDSIPKGFNIFRNDTLLNYTTISSFADEKAHSENNKYCVEAIYKNCISEKNCILVSEPVGLQYIEELHFSISPNPTNDFLKISGNNTNEIEEIVIYNLLGKKIASYTNTDFIDVSKLKKGTYLLKLYCKKQVSIYKFVKN